MKTKLVLTIIGISLLVFQLGYCGDTAVDISSNLSLSAGIQMNSTQFGNAVSVTSPYFLNDKTAVRFTYGFRDLTNNDYTLDYLVSTFITPNLRGYIKSGFSLIASAKGSNSYGVSILYGTGLEFFPKGTSQLTVFTELGGLNSFRSQDYGNGIQGITGIKIYL